MIGEPVTSTGNPALGITLLYCRFELRECVSLSTWTQIPDCTWQRLFPGRRWWRCWQAWPLSCGSWSNGGAPPNTAPALLAGLGRLSQLNSLALGFGSAPVTAAGAGGRPGADAAVTAAPDLVGIQTRRGLGGRGFHSQRLHQLQAAQAPGALPRPARGRARRRSRGG